MRILVSEAIEAKLRTKHNLTVTEVEQCFSNWEGYGLEDTNEEHKTDPPSIWFIAQTNAGKVLKVIYVDGGKGVFKLKSAFQANQKQIDFYLEQYPDVQI